MPRRERVQAVEVLTRTLAEGDGSLRRPALSALEVLREHSVARPLKPLARPLYEALTEHPGRRAALMEGLTALTDARFTADMRLWRDWWKRVEAEDPKIPPFSRLMQPGFY